MSNFTITQQPVRILNGTQSDGVTLTNVGNLVVYVANDSAATTISQPLDIGGSMYFEPYSELWGTVNSTTMNGQLSGTFSASDRFNNPTPGISFIGSFPTTTVGGDVNFDFDLGSSLGSQFKAFKIVVRFPNSGFSPTTAGNYEYSVGADLNFQGQNQQSLYSSILIDTSVLPVTNLAPAYVIVPLTTATSGTLFITPPANTAAAGELVMDVYGLANAPAQVIAWSNPILCLSTVWKQKGNTYYYEIASTATFTTVLLPAMGANFTIGATATNAATLAGQNLVIQTFTATPATTATKYSWDSPLIAFTAGGQTLANQRTYTTTPGLPLAIRINTNLSTITDIRIWIQNNAQIGA